MTQGMAHSYGGRVRTNVIAPGVFATDISQAWTESFRREIDRIVTMGRAGEAREIVGAALYLASDAASYTSGAVIKVDGGFAYG
jgi:NAD(P)-dependent dehydrogenase (short-subunit alcohol dehydrogenase family)